MAQHTNAPTPNPASQFARPFAIMVACLLGLVLPNVHASAQVEPIEAKWMTVTRDTPMRCGELATFYKVADLKAGDVVRVDAISPRWARLVYPAGQHAFVSKRDTAGVADGRLTLTDSARVRAPNAISGLTGSWRSLYLGDIQKGAELVITGEAKAADGQVVGYRIVPPTPPIAPHTPWGYAELSALRDSTATEIAAHEASLEAARTTTDPESATPSESDTAASDSDTEPDAVDAEASQDSTTAPAPETAPAESAPSKPAAGNDAPAQPAEPDAAVQPASQTPDTSLLQEMVPPTEAPAEAPANTQAETQPSNEPEAQQPAIPSSQTEPAAPAAQASPKPVQSWLNWADLESELVRARRAGGDVLEDSLEELIAEYQRTMDNSPNPNVRAAVSSRLEWLRARRDARDQRRALDAAMAEAERLRSNAQTRVRTWRSNRGYDIVGRLVPSGIYDGRRLPRMYRIQAVAADGLVRTIGYIRESETLNIESQLGQIVGVVGDSRLDEALRLRVITPRRIERLGPAADAMPGG